MKEVFVQFSGRSKSIRFQSMPGQSDVDALRGRLVEVSLKDEDLQSRMLNCTIVFQRERVKGNGDKVLVDVEEEDVIIDESDLQIVFAPLITSLPCVNSEAITPPSSPISELGSVQVLKIVPIARSIDVSPDSGEKSCISPTLSGTKTTPETPVSSASPLPSGSRKKSAKKEMSSPASRPFALPPLSDHLKTLESVIGSDSKPFIKFYGDAMRTSFNDVPTQGDYDVVGKAIVHRHPSLADKCAIRPHNIVCSLLSTYIRNAKARERKAKRALATTDELTQNAPPAKRLKFSVPGGQSSNGLTEEDMAAMDSELQKLALEGDTPHVKRLLKDSFPLRKQWISNSSETTRPADIIERFPHLQNVELLLQELTLRLPSDKLESVLGTLDQLFANVSMALNEEYGQSDEDQLTFLISLYNRLKPKNVPKKFPDLLTIKEALSPLGNDLVSNENEGARAVFYIHDKTISVAFVVADNMKLKIENPSVTKCVLALAAFYHGFDRTYPTAYKSFFNMIDEMIFKLKVVNASTSYKIFKKNYLSSLI